jgi:hypothetical protein
MRPLLVKSTSAVALVVIAVAGVAAGVALGSRGGKPTLVARPAIHGVNSKGRTLTAFRGRWSGAKSFSYEWDIHTGRGWERVARGSAATKVLVSARIARAPIRLRVTARNASGATVATSRELRPSPPSTPPATTTTTTTTTTAATNPGTTTTAPTTSTESATTSTGPGTTSSTPTTTPTTTTTATTTTTPTTTALRSAHLTPSADPLDFGSVRVGESSAPMTVTFTNTGEHDTGSLSVSIITGDLYNFTVVSSDCNYISVPPGGSCSATVLFAPRSTGTKFQDVYVTDGYPASAGIAGLTGVGTA